MALSANVVKATEKKVAKKVQSIENGAKAAKEKVVRAEGRKLGRKLTGRDVPVGRSVSRVKRSVDNSRAARMVDSISRGGKYPLAPDAIAHIRDECASVTFEMAERVGDKVKEKTLKVEGFVESVGWFAAVLPSDWRKALRTKAERQALKDDLESILASL